MAIKQSQHIIKGIQRDLTRSKFSLEYAFDAYNIRITAREDDSFMSVTNEKGTKNMPLKNNGTDAIIEGTIIGQNVLNDYLTLFTTGDVDRIYRLLRYDDYFELIQLFSGDLNFSTDSPIESLGVFENESILKVYWVDGRNQPRVINITSSNDVISLWNSNSFNFVLDLELSETVTIERSDLSSGTFAAGVILYALSYYNKYGLESNLFYVSPLNYISFLNRGGSPEDKASNSFKITINNVDTKFDYLRIYSIHRTSIDAVPTVLNVIDLPIESATLSYIDNGSLGTLVDPTELLYIGGESIIAGTMAQKDNTLFFGDITIDRPAIPQDIKDDIKISDNVISVNGVISATLRLVLAENNFRDSYYKYTNFLSKGNTAGFKSGENYRLGIQFQYKTGKWSEPVFIGDYIVSDSIRPDLVISDEVSTLYIPQIEYTLTYDILTKLTALGYKRARPIVVLPSIQDRRIVLQGMLCPTVFNFENRYNNTPFSLSSWFLRPFLPWNITLSSVEDSNRFIELGAWVEFRHHYGICNGSTRNAEILNISHKLNEFYNLSSFGDSTTTVEVYPDIFMVDLSILTMHSPDIEFDDAIKALDYGNLNLRLVGAVNFTSSVGDIDIQTSSPTIHPKATGFVHRTVGVLGPSDLAARSLVSGLFYKDWIVDDHSGEFRDYSKLNKESAWLVYPWQKSGSINNDISRTEGARSAVLSKKKISNLKFSEFNQWFKPSRYWYAKQEGSQVYTGITNVLLFNSEEVTLTKIPIPENSVLKSMNYYGNVDTILPSKNEYKQYFTGLSEGSWITTSFTDVTFSNVEEHVSDIGDDSPNLKNSKDPVRMKYKSSPHFVFGFNYSKNSGSLVILPTTYGVSGGSSINIIEDSTAPFWSNIGTSIPGSDFRTIKYITKEGSSTGALDSGVEWETGDYYYDLNTNLLYVYNTASDTSFSALFTLLTLSYLVGQLFKYVDVDDGNTRYYDVRNIGLKYQLYEYGTDYDDVEFSVKQATIGENVKYPYLFLAELYREESALTNIFGGTSDDALKSNIWIPSGEPVTLGNSNVVLKHSYGDTWYLRYDCLKTYPFTLEDENSVVEIGSFMCETRVNIDGRYDRNRGLVSNLVTTPTNFNLMNKVYTLRDNFFTHRILDEDFYNLNTFSNTITWTKEKSSGEIVDTWTNITVASTLDLDGDKGKITSLNTYNNEIYCFLERGFSNILFNSRVQIPTSDGVPIEITNGLKVQGKRYISNYIGCVNKWSITETPVGLYFIDNDTDTIYLFNGLVNALSNKLGFSLWLSENSSQSVWNPVDFDNFISYYDKSQGDIYYINSSNCLCYSETVSQFTSFMSYENVPYMFNMDNKLYSIKSNKIWQNFAGDYNIFYGKFRPCSITMINSADSPYDKIYNNIDFRADAWTGKALVTEPPFDTLNVWTEYLHGYTELYNNKNIPSPIKRKFRIWRVKVPRANTEINGIAANGRDRIRNTWAYIKLSKEAFNTNKIDFHDMIVHYFI